MARDWSAREEVLERFLLGFEGPSLPEWLADMLSAGLAGVAIYPRNYTDPGDLLALTTAIRSAAGRPVLIGIDQEGGTRFALPPPFTQWPSPAELGRLDAAENGQMEVRSDVHCNTGEYFTARIARAIARELRAVGINLDFAPMLDLATNPDSPVTADRSFGSDPGRVAAARHFISARPGGRRRVRVREAFSRPRRRRHRSAFRFAKLRRHTPNGLRSMNWRRLLPRSRLASSW